MLDLRAFLQRLALDDAFRNLLCADPEAAFAGYALTEAQQAALRRRDEEWLALIGEAVRAGTPPAPAAPEPPAPGGPKLPEARILLRLRPQPLGDERWAWAVSVHPWPPPEPDPTMAGFLVRVVPRTTSAAGEALKVAYTATIQPAPPDAEAPLAPVSDAPSSAWGHRADTPEARAAAAAVLAAPEGERYERLLDLIGAVAGEAP